MVYLPAILYIMSNYLQKGRIVCKKKKYLLPSTKELKKEEKKDEDQKGLALILALAMIITLMPTMAFASTTNTVDKTYSVAADEDMPTVYIDLKVTSTNGIAAGEENKFKLTLENAEWNAAPADEVTDDNIIGSAVTVTNEENAAIGTTTATATTEDSTTLTFKATDLIAKDSYIRLALKLHAGSDDGAVKVAIDGLDSAITSQTLTVANVGSGTTTATVTGKVESFDRSTFDAAKVEITETAVNSITGNQILKLTLPKGVSWNGIDVTGDLVDSWIDVTEDYDDNDGRTKYISITVESDLDVRQSIIIEPKLTIGKDASNGDITLSIAGYKATSGNSVADADDLVIAVYGEESVDVYTVDEENLPEVVAGYVTDKKDKNFVLQVTFEESLPGALSAGRFIDFDLPDEVQVVDGKDIKAYVGTGSSSYTKNSSPISDTLLDIDEGTAKDRSEFTLTVPASSSEMKGWSTTKANKMTIYIPVTVQADFTGDITMSIKGAKAGIEDTELVVGTVISPITVTTDITKVVNGAQQQATADITIKENIPGYLTSDAGENQVALLVDTLNLTNGVSFTNADVEVTEGDLLIKDFKVNNSSLTFNIKDSSTKESTIEITGVEIAMSRILPEGSYDLKVGGTALIQNNKYNNMAFDSDESDVYAASVPYIEITTSPDTEQGINATFTDGQASYTLNGETIEMDVAPYIDSNNRMLVPIRFAANAMGVSDENIQWNSYTQTGTISGAMGVVRVTVGSTNLITSNGTITMDTVAVNTNDRIYVPVRYIANALGASVSWDPATRTATFS